MIEALEYVLAGFIVAAAAIALGRSIVLGLKDKPSALTACAGCKLHDICIKPEKNSAKKCADKVAQVKKQQ